jgi:integrase/recombinase XerD
MAQQTTTPGPRGSVWCGFFASWLHGFDPRTEVPPPGLISSKQRRSRPYIYTDDQIVEIVTEAGRLPSSYGLRGWTCSTLFGLIVVAGLRVSEAIGFDDKDVDLKEAVLSSQAREERPMPLRSAIALRS